MYINETNLVLNERGAIYHLNLLPNEIANNIITVGDPDRVSKISKYFDKIEFKIQHREFVTHTGYLNNKHISVLSTGIGTDNIDIVFNELDFLKNANFKNRTYLENKTTCNIIRLGTCGSLQENIPVDSFIVGEYGIGIDNLLLFYKSFLEENDHLLLQEFINHTKINTIQINPYIFSSSPYLLNYFNKPEIFKGITVTCPGFYGPQGRIGRIPLALNSFIDSLSSFKYKNVQVLNFEMETSAMYGLGKLLNHNCISLNVAIMNRVKKVFSNNMDAAVEKLIQKGLEIILNIP